jgi:hypothetical protein
VFARPTRQQLNRNVDSLHCPVLTMASRVRQALRNCPPGEMRIHRHPTVLELDAWYDLDVLSRVAELTNFIADASNFEGSAFWDPDTTSGVGGWGDPNDDYQVPNGGFATGFSLSYPSPHRLRRNYTATFLSRNLVDAIMPANVAALVNGFVGSFIGFQADLESGPHGSAHFLVGGCVNLLPCCRFVRSHGPPRDLGGMCPANAPADCVPGARWSSNGPCLISVHTPTPAVLTFQ